MRAIVRRAQGALTARLSARRLPRRRGPAAHNAVSWTTPAEGGGRAGSCVKEARATPPWPRARVSHNARPEPSLTPQGRLTRRAPWRGRSWCSPADRMVPARQARAARAPVLSGRVPASSCHPSLPPRVRTAQCRTRRRHLPAGAGKRRMRTAVLRRGCFPQGDDESKGGRVTCPCRIP